MYIILSVYIYEVFLSSANPSLCTNSLLLSSPKSDKTTVTTFLK